MKHFFVGIFCCLITSFTSAQFRSQPNSLPTSDRSRDLFSIQLNTEIMHMHYEEPSVMNEKNFLPGVSGEIRWNPLFNFGLSFGGSHFDGHLHYTGATFDGVPVEVITRDYVTNYRLMGHFYFENWDFSAGIAKREWFDDLIISYTRTTRYQYFPVRARLQMNPFYVAAEYRLWGGGENISTMSKVDPARSDVTLKQNSGMGYALELGVDYPFGAFDGQLHLIFDYWSVEDSEVQSDGVQPLVEPKNFTRSVSLGFGLRY